MKALLTIDEASKLTKLSVKTLYTYAEKETIPHIKLGRRVLFEEDRLEEWVTGCRVTPTAEAVTIYTDGNEADVSEFTEEQGESA